MGQYYSVALFSEKATKYNRRSCLLTIEPSNWWESARLMHQAVFGNWIVNFVLYQLQERKRARVVWCGDYADPEPNSDKNLNKLLEGCKEPQKSPDLKFLQPVRYIVNHSKHQYIGLTRCKNHNKEGDLIHPLPILCCEGNGRGGGDFYPKNRRNQHYIGLWARDVLSVSNKPPAGDFKEIYPNFEEEL